MAHKIKEHAGIKGIRIGELEIFLAQFADDTQMFLDSINSLENTISTLDKIEANTGLKVNYEKSCIYTIGEHNIVPECSKPLVWDPGGMEILRINVTDSAERQYEKILQNAQQVLSTWYYHSLTLYGKVININTLVIPVFVYTMQVLKQPSEAKFKQFELLIENFLWRSKKPKIPMQILQNSIQAGGMKLTNLKNKNKSLKIGWLFCTDELSENMLKQLVPEELGTLFWDCAISPTDIKNYLSNKECDFFLEGNC